MNSNSNIYIRVWILAITFIIASHITAGGLDAVAPPGATMHTVEQIYQRLLGREAAAGSLDPGTAPASTMHTMEDIYQQLNITNTFSSTGTVVQAGWYSATNLLQVEQNLVPGKISAGVTIFGITGLYEGEIIYTNATAAVPRTGQTTTYAASDDGALTNGVAWPAPRFTDNSDGTISDNLTGLIWLKNANAFGPTNWATSLTNCNTLNHGEHGLSDGSSEGDWRLPNVRELRSLIDHAHAKFQPALQTGHPFTGLSDTYHYWSSTTYAGGAGSAWASIMNSGRISFSTKTLNNNYTWPIRGGQK